jgi:ABC-2 type transport system permease protein
MKKPFTFILMLLLPLFFTFVFGNMGSGTSKVPVSIVDLDKSPNSKLLVEKIKDLKGYKVTVSKSKNSVINNVKDFTVLSALVINKGFGEDIKKTKVSVDMYKVSQSEDLIYFANKVQSSIESINTNIKVANIAIENISKTKKINENSIRKSIYKSMDNESKGNIITVKSSELSSNKALKYDALLHSVIGFTIFFVMYTIIFGIGEILEEKRIKTWDRLNIMPIKSHQLLGGNILATFITGYIQILILVILGKSMFNINWGNNLGLILLLFAAFTYSISGIGLFISGFLKTTKQLEAITPILVVATGMLGGCFWPVEYIGNNVMVILAKCTPQYWVLESVTDVVKKGSGLNDVLTPLLILLGIGTLFFAAGSFKMALKKEN